MIARSAFAPRRQNSHRADVERRCPGFLKWLRGRPCAAVGCKRDGRMEAAHVDHAGGKGTGLKVADQHAIPLCGGPDGCHARQHRIGWRTFERTQLPGGDAVKLAAIYWTKWPGRPAWENRA